MSKSLKSCLPVLADVLKANLATLYERQRALVREGLLESLPGHGRGKGVRTSPESIATLIIGMLASVSLAEVGSLARSFSKAVPALGPVCPLTGAKTFQGALSCIFSDESLSKRVNEITVRVNAGHAAIAFDGGNIGQDMDFVMLATRIKNAKVSRGGKPLLPISVFSTRKHQENGLLVSLSIPHETVRKLTTATISLLADTEEA
jgi:hypothetical protein